MAPRNLLRSQTRLEQPLETRLHRLGGDHPPGELVLHLCLSHEVHEGLLVHLVKAVGQALDDVLQIVNVRLLEGGGDLHHIGKSAVADRPLHDLLDRSFQPPVSGTGPGEGVDDGLSGGLTSLGHVAGQERGHVLAQVLAMAEVVRLDHLGARPEAGQLALDEGIRPARHHKSNPGRETPAALADERQQRGPRRAHLGLVQGIH